MLVGDDAVATSPSRGVTVCSLFLPERVDGGSHPPHRQEGLVSFIYRELGRFNGGGVVVVGANEKVIVFGGVDVDVVGILVEMNLIWKDLLRVEIIDSDIIQLDHGT